MYEYEFDPEAKNNTAATIFHLAFRKNGRALDLGSGPGIVASALASEGMDVTCIDADEASVEAARLRGVARALVADLNGSDWIEAVAGRQYEVIILADILEHLWDPGHILDLISANNLLTEDGKLVISIPNVAHESVIASLIAGQFPYTDTGLLDRTHIRFFTLATFRSFCESHGYLVRKVDRTTRTIEQSELAEVARDIAPTLREELRYEGSEARTYQFILTVEPVSVAGELVALRREVQEAYEAKRRAEKASAAAEKTGEEFKIKFEEEKARRDEVTRALERLKEINSRSRRSFSKLDQKLSKVERELDSAKTQMRGFQQRETELIKVAERRRREISALQSKLGEVYDSETWRAGKAVLWLPKRLTGRSPSSPTQPRQERPWEKRAPLESNEPNGPQAASPYRLALHLDEEADARARYAEALRRSTFDVDKRGIVFAVSTKDLDAGRGDLFTAIGLGLALEDFGWQAIYLAPHDWYQPPTGTEVFVSLIAEPTIVVNATKLTAVPKLIAWIRNNTDRWLDRGQLALYDAVLCSSEHTKERIANMRDVPCAILGIGVDPEVFTPGGSTAGSGVAATINQWGRLRRTYRHLDELANEGSIDFPLGVYGAARNLPNSLSPYRHGTVSFFSLASLYHQVAIVLDDQQGVNAPFGNVNSRIFEAIASGALPITASARGLERLGLGDVPTYSTASELKGLVIQFSDEAIRAPLVDRLRSTVLERHTYQVRARDFHRLVEGLDGADGSKTPRPVVGYHPDYRVTNPYQDMVYRSVPDVGVSSIPGVSLHDFVRSRNPMGRPRVFHQHWTAPILGPSRDDDDAERRLGAYLEDIDRLQASGGRFVWTVHNIMPHECPRPKIEMRLRQGIADRADAIHVMCARTVALAGQYYSLPSDRIWVIPHPSYQGVYPNVLNRAVARETLDLPEDAFVYLCLGQIRPYKGVERLLSSFSDIHAEDTSTRLLLSGAPGRQPVMEALVAQADAAPGVLVTSREVGDEELQTHLAASDVLVLPHRRVLNSGLAMLGITFGRPLVAPATGCLTELVAPEFGVTFDPEAESLAPEMLKVREMNVELAQTTMAELAERLRPSRVSQQMVDLLFNS